MSEKMKDRKDRAESCHDSGPTVRTVFANAALHKPCILMVAPTGARLQKNTHANVPLSIEEIVRTAVSTWEAGGRALHLHVRDDNGEHSLDPSRVRMATAAIRAELGEDIVIQMSTEAAGRYRPEEQIIAVKEGRPEAISLAVREIMRAAPDTCFSFFKWLSRENLPTQFLLYDLADLGNLIALIEVGQVQTQRPSVLFGLGSHHPPRAGHIEDLKLIQLAVEDAASRGVFLDWMVCCFGRDEAKVTKRASQLGGHIRVGFENNTLLPNGLVAEDNTQLVELALQSLNDNGRRPASARDIRDAWQMAWSN
jgi:uncharacterized protein (DUF849 family)